MINKNKNDNFRLIKPAGIFNLIHGGLAALFYIMFLMNSFNLISISKLTENAIVFNVYMAFQLTIVVFGIIAAIYSIRARQQEKQLIYYGSFAIAGIDSTLLFLMGQMTVCCVINIITGILMIKYVNEKERMINADYSFGGSSKGLSDKKSTANIIDNIKEAESSAEDYDYDNE